ncbi:hypothetical protein BC832DRAFT_246981 [Gaertneriomyces semiglobifer]|nr:hypothetical protein BC832DRAFT_246981 [Gaertneriomyces semiglobifer]
MTSSPLMSVLPIYQRRSRHLGSQAVACLFLQSIRLLKYPVSEWTPHCAGIERGHARKSAAVQPFYSSTERRLRDRGQALLAAILFFLAHSSLRRFGSLRSSSVTLYPSGSNTIAGPCSRRHHIPRSRRLEA